MSFEFRDTVAVSADARPLSFELRDFMDFSEEVLFDPFRMESLVQVIGSTESQSLKLGGRSPALNAIENK